MTRIREEFLLNDLSDAGQLHAFREFRLRLRSLGIRDARLRVAAPYGSMPTALYWHWVLRTEAVGTSTILDGNVALPGLVVWTAGAGRIISSEARVLCGFPHGSGAEAAERIAAAMCFTEAQERDGFRRRTAEEWLTRQMILGPDQLRKAFHAQLEETRCPHCGK